MSAIGDVIYQFNPNKRRYQDDQGNKTTAPFYPAHFTEYKIIGVDKKSWVIATPNGRTEKISMKMLEDQIDQKHEWYSTQGKSDAIWLNHHRQEILKQLMYGNQSHNANLWRAIARLIDYQE